MATVLRDEHRAGPFAAVMHCFSGGPALAHTSLELGHFLSFSGLLGYEGHEALRALVATLPASALLVETDAPSLPPVEADGARNEPRPSAPRRGAPRAAARRNRGSRGATDHGQFPSRLSQGRAGLSPAVMRARRRRCCPRTSRPWHHP